MSGTTELTQETGATYRQLDYWIKQGLIPGLSIDAANPGSGFARELTTAQSQHVRVMVRLVNDGVRPPRASVLACALSKGRTATIGGFTVTG